MTVSSTTVKNSYSGNSSTTAFAYTFKIFADTDLQVIIRSSTGTETTKTLTTHYTVSGAGDASGGNVTFTSGNTPATGETVVIRRGVPQTQAIDYIANDPFPAESHEEGLDRATMTTQQVQEELDRSIKLSRTNTMTSTEFTVGTRTVPGIKSPTMVAVGKGGKILSRDCDLIIADDIEDHSSTMQPASRENTRNWWTTTLSSRKEEHTAMIVIGSRQHYDDLYSHLLDNESWETTVEEAHDTACTKTDWNEEDHKDCMLWSSKRSYKWLMDRKRAAETTGGRAIYEMVYLNVAIPEGLSLFSREEIEAADSLDLP